MGEANGPKVGSFNKNDADVATGLVGAPACGDVMKLQIRVDKDTNVISDVRFKTFGCGSAIASSSYLTELVRGMTLEEAGKIKNTEIARELCKFFRGEAYIIIHLTFANITLQAVSYQSFFSLPLNYSALEYVSPNTCLFIVPQRRTLQASQCTYMG